MISHASFFSADQFRVRGLPIYLLAGTTNPIINVIQVSQVRDIHGMRDFNVGTASCVGKALSIASRFLGALVTLVTELMESSRALFSSLVLLG